MSQLYPNSSQLANKSRRELQQEASILRGELFGLILQKMVSDDGFAAIKTKIADLEQLIWWDGNKAGQEYAKKDSRKSV